MRTASDLKVQTRRQINPIPRDGTRLRSLYDLFHSSKGQVIDYSHPTDGRIMSDLIEYYGLDIRRVGRCKWVLAGEWFGSKYLDYIAEHLTSLEQGAA